MWLMQLAFSAVWATYTNEIGWESAFVVVATGKLRLLAKHSLSTSLVKNLTCSISTGLINPAYVFLGLDVTVHIADDSKDPGRDVPLALGSSVISACVVFSSFFPTSSDEPGRRFITAFATGIALSYAIQDYAAAAASP